MSLLEVDKLSVRYPGIPHAAVDGVSFSVAAGGSLGIVGESGAGKSQLALALMGLLPAHSLVNGSVVFDGTELAGAERKTLNRFRAGRIAMVFQDPLGSLNPYLRIGDQLRRILIEHRFGEAAAAPGRVLKMLEKVGLSDPDRQYRAYPHQLSGGMRQRVMIAAALLGEPDLLVADEPTTALDVTVQAQLLSMLETLRSETGTALLLITHDLGVVASQCERMLVMDQGKKVEEGQTTEVFSAPTEDKTRAIIDAAPSVEHGGLSRMLPAGEDTVLDIENVTVDFEERRGLSRQALHAVRSTNISVRRSEVLAVVGESGSGKTSLARAVLGLLPKASGQIALLGEALPDAVNKRNQATHRNLQMVFQDPQASLNPAMNVASIIAEPLHVHAGTSSDIGQSVEVALQRVGLGVEFARRMPHELSGGQAQRVAIARALILKPKVLICDEAVAALDGTIQAEILTLLRKEQEHSGLAIVFISHDLAVVQQISHRVAVMYMGRLVEVADASSLFRRPRHPYTKLLLNSVLRPDPTAQATPAPSQQSGEVVSVFQAPTGCPFHPRCSHAVAVCSDLLPELSTTATSQTACHRAEEIDLSY